MSEREYTCVDCGGPRCEKAKRRCQSCDVIRIVAVQKERSRVLREKLERLWADGHTFEEIGREMGWNNPRTNISWHRRRGAKLPQREPDYVVRRESLIAAGLRGTPDECVLPSKDIDPDAYFGLGINYRGARLHRLVWERAHGPIPEHDQVHHRCEVKACCNLAHLELLTPLEHMRLHKLGQRFRGRKLTIAERAEVARRAVAGERTAVLAEEFGISQSWANKIHKDADDLMARVR